MLEALNQETRPNWAAFPGFNIYMRSALSSAYQKFQV